MQEALDSTTPLQRFVLLAVADLDAREGTGARSFDVREFCEAHLEDLGGDPFGGGGVTRQGVLRALSKLDAAGLLQENVGDQSPVGKGRPIYSLAEDADTVLTTLADDDQFGPLAESLRTESE
jgi:hypothetical protein